MTIINDTGNEAYVLLLIQEISKERGGAIPISFGIASGNLIFAGVSQIHHMGLIVAREPVGIPFRVTTFLGKLKR